MGEIRDYSVTADDNNATPPAGAPEGMAPSTVNNTMREAYARIKRWYEDCQGAKTTGGSSNAYTLAAARTVASYAAGDSYMFKANHTNTSAGSTLNVDSVGAKAIVTPTGAAIAAGSITSGGVYLVAYEASVDKFMLIGGSHSGGDNPFIYNSSPTLTLENSTSEDTSGGRESQVVFKGLQSGSEESTLVKITASHEGTSDDQKGQLVIGVNDGNDNDAPTTAMTVASTGVTLSAASGNATVLQIDADEDSASSGPKIILNRTSDSPADDDYTGTIIFQGENDNNQQFKTAQLSAQAKDVSDGTEDSQLQLATMVNGTLTNGLVLENGRINSSAFSPAGSIVQVVQNTSVGQASTSSTSLVDITNFTVDITPSSTSNRVIVMFSAHQQNTLVTGANAQYWHKFVGGNLGVSGKLIPAASWAGFSVESGGGGLQGKGSYAWIGMDNPESTSAVTYKVQHYVTNGSSTGFTYYGQIVAMEVQV